MKTRALSILVVLSCSIYGGEAKEETVSGSSSHSAGVLAVSIEKISEILRVLEAPYGKMKSLSYNAARKRTTSNSEVEDSWSFTYRHPSDIRVEYTSPQRRILVINADDIWEYLPDQRAAMHTDLRQMSKTEKDKAIGKAISPVSVSGLRPGNYNHLLSGVTSSDQSGTIVTIKGEEPPAFLLKVDTEKNALLVSELYDGDGAQRLKTVCSKHKLIYKDLWVPREIRTVTRVKNQYVTDLVKISEISVDHACSDSLFTFKKRGNVRVLESRPKKE